MSVAPTASTGVVSAVGYMAGGVASIVLLTLFFWRPMATTPTGPRARSDLPELATLATQHGEAAHEVVPADVAALEHAMAARRVVA